MPLHIGKITRLSGFSINVTDLSRAVAFYCDALGFTQQAAACGWAELAADGRDARTATLRLGDQILELAQFGPPGAPYPAASTAADLWFQHFAIVTNDAAAVYARLQSFGVTAITSGGPQLLPPGAGSVTAFKFRDPDGHPLELIQFPAGSGDPRWQRGGAGSTLGIDHSAISVSDAGRSIAFYGELSLTLQTWQTNSGAAQDHLDGLAQVEVDVIGLAPLLSATPHLELLAYRSPVGRENQPMAGTSDIAATRLIFEASDLPDRFSLLRDPDRHVLMLVPSITPL